MPPREQILPIEHRSQITIDPLIKQTLYIFKLNKVYSSSFKSVWWSRECETRSHSKSYFLLISSIFRCNTPYERIGHSTARPDYNRMGSESIAHLVEGPMGYWLWKHEGENNNCFSKIQLVGQKNIETKHLSLVKAIILVFKAGAFRQ